MYNVRSRTSSCARRMQAQRQRPRRASRRMRSRPRGPKTRTATSSTETSLYLICVHAPSRVLSSVQPALATRCVGACCSNVRLAHAARVADDIVQAGSRARSVTLAGFDRPGYASHRRGSWKCKIQGEHPMSVSSRRRSPRYPSSVRSNARSLSCTRPGFSLVTRPGFTATTSISPRCVCFRFV
jgi:hypothetical protein